MMPSHLLRNRLNDDALDKYQLNGTACHVDEETDRCFQESVCKHCYSQTNYTKHHCKDEDLSFCDEFVEEYTNDHSDYSSYVGERLESINLITFASVVSEFCSQRVKVVVDKLSSFAG